MSQPLSASIPPAAVPPARQWSPATRWAIFMAVAVVVIGVGLVAARPAYARFKRYRAAQVAREASRMLAAGDLAGATRLAQTAQKMAPADVDVARATGQVCAKTGEAVGLDAWENVLRSGQATRQDWLDAAGLAIRLGRVDRSGPWLATASKTFPKDPVMLRMVLRHVLRLGDQARAIQYARGILREFPADPEAQFDLGRLLVGSVDPRARGDGQSLLWDLAAGKSGFRERSVELLAAGSDLGRAQDELLVRLIEGRTNAPLSARLLALDVRARIDPSSKSALAQRALAMAPAVPTVGEMGTLALWLNRNGSNAEVLGMLPMERCRTNPVLMTVRLDAMLALGQANEIGQIAVETPNPVNAALSSTARGIVAMRAGRRAEGEAFFRDALKVRPRIPQALFLAARQAESVGLPEVAIEAYQSLIEVPEFALDAGRRLLRLAKPLDDLKLSRDTLRLLNAFMPGEEIVAGERAWMEALFGKESEFAFAALGNLARTRTNQPGWRYGFALATWRRGDAAGGLALVEQPPMDWETMEPRWQAVYVALLGANQQREAARRFARRIDPTRLKSQERQLIAAWQ